LTAERLPAVAVRREAAGRWRAWRRRANKAAVDSSAGPPGENRPSQQSLASLCELVRDERQMASDAL
jgi:hypothetical protein